MNKYFTTFKDIDAYNNFVASQELPNINVSYIVDSDDVKYYKEHVSLQPFTMEIVSLPEGIDSIPLSFVTYNYTANDWWASHGKFKFSYDEGETWTNWYEVNGAAHTFNDEIVLHEGDKLSIIGGYGNIVNIMHFFQDRYIPTGGVKINVSGNVSSLLLGEDFYLRTLDEIDYQYGADPWDRPFGPFANLFNTTDFNDVVWVLDASDLWLPGSGLVPSCYANMFTGQTYLTTDIPNIYADYLPARACVSMFEGCTSLTTMPEIYATTFEYGNSIDYMFKNCTSLVTTTALRVKHINNDSYGNIFGNTFEGCTSLTTAPQFSFTQLEDINMIVLIIGSTFSGCTSLTSCDWDFNFESIGSTLNLDLYHMFDGCTSLSTSPVIAGSSKQISPNYMFNNCTSLSTIIWTNTALGPEYLGNFTEDLSTLPATGTLVLADSMTQEGWLGVMVPSTWTIMTWTQYQNQNNS